MEEELGNRNNLLNKHVSVNLKTNFVLFGIVVDQSSNGIWLKTNTETSFINYDNILMIKKDRWY